MFKKLNSKINLNMRQNYNKDEISQTKILINLSLTLGMIYTTGLPKVF